MRLPLSNPFPRLPVIAQQMRAYNRCENSMRGMEFLSNKHEIMVVSLESRAAKLFDFSLGQNGAISSGNWWLFHLKDHEVKVYFCPFTRLRPKTTAYFIF